MKLILIRGPICAGKSTIVDLLKNKIKNSSQIDFDAFKRAIDWTKASEWRDKMAFKTALFLAQELMKTKRIIIADIHSSQKYQYDQFKKLAKKYNYKFYTFLIYPPLNVCLKRNERRDIPDVKYKISNKEIKDYWEKTIKIKDEMIFDSAKLKPKEIDKIILNEIKK